MGANMIT